MSTTAAENEGSLASARQWFQRNKLKAIGTFWAASVTGVLAYQWKTKPLVPTNLKIIHARVAAQALTLAALAAAAAVDVYEHKAETQRELERVAKRLEHVESKVHGK